MATKDRPLQGFNKLSKTILLYTPDSPPAARQDGLPQPDLILIFSWMAASPKHIEKYTTAYQSRYVGSPILLIQSELDDWTFRLMSKQMAFIEPAVTFLQSFLKDKQDTKILMHCFSNGGAWNALKLARAWNERPHNKPIPIVANIMDSCPSLPRARAAYTAMTLPLANQPLLFRLIASFFAILSILTVFLIDKLHIKENMIIKLRKSLNDRKNPYIYAERTYICSASDQIVEMDDVVAHSEETRQVLASGRVGSQAEKKRSVKVEEFHGSGHVGHVRVDEARYWQVVDETWERGVRHS